jgi:hypothetical protein
MDQPIRAALVAELTALLAGGNAHATFEQALAELPPTLRNQAVPEVPYTIWHLVEHLRIAQWDIVEFCLNPNHKSPDWPTGYWPARGSSVRGRLAGRAAHHCPRPAAVYRLASEPSH